MLALLGAAAAIAALVATSGGQAASSAKKPVVIGWAFDKSGQMAPFDDPALAAAKIRIKKLNARGGAAGHKFVIKTCDTQNNDASKAKSCALSLLGARREHPLHDLRRRLRDAGRPGGDQPRQAGDRDRASAPTRWGRSASARRRKLAFSFGNVAQDEGSAMAQYAMERGWKTAGLATNTLLVYFKNVVQAFDKRFTPARRQDRRRARVLRDRREQRQRGRQRG